MSRFGRVRVQQAKSGILPSYLQPIRGASPVRFNPALPTAGQIVRSTGQVRLGSSRPRGKTELAHHDRNRSAA